MVTDSNVATPSECTAAEPREGGPRPRPRRPRSSGGRRRVFRTLAAVGLAGGLIGFNAWWYWRDTRPLADARTVDGWIARKEYARAESALTERLRRSPHDGAARMTLARVLAARGDLPGCARELQRVPYWWPEKAQAQFRAAQALLMADRARDAESVLLTILDADPLHPPDPGLYHDAGQELLKIYATEDRWDDAYSVIWKTYDHAAPQDRAPVLSMRIRCELERVAPTEALKVLRRYVAADPGDFEARRSMANAELAVGQRTEALRDMKDCLRGRPEDVRTWRDYLTMLQSLGEQGAFDAALARVPRSADSEPEIWMFRGQIKERDGDWPGAAADYRRALELNPNLLNGHYRLAMIEVRLGRREEAVAHRKRWEEIRDARVQLRQADEAYRRALAAAYATTPSPTARDELRASGRRLASVCGALGWTRAAEAWHQVVAGF